jgi:hypothetical protein
LTDGDRIVDVSRGSTRHERSDYRQIRGLTRASLAAARAAAS